MDDDGIITVENFSVTTTDITPKNHHTWGCPLYVLDARLKGNIAGLTKWESPSCAKIYLGRSPFHAVSVALVLNPSTGYVSPKFHMVFDDEFSIVPFMREGTIHPNWTDLVQRISKNVAPDNIAVKYTWFTPDIG